MTCLHPGQSSDSTLAAGPVVSITYRNGHTCSVSRAGAGADMGGCPPVGYEAPPIHTASAATLAAPIGVTSLPAHRYCVGGPLTLTPCRPGLTPLNGDPRYLLVDIAFRAHVGVSTTDSYYLQTEINPGDPGCVGGSAETLDAVRAGQRVVFQDQVPSRCHGVIDGTVSYVPDSGPGGSGASSAPTGRLGRGPGGSVLVGHYVIHLPGRGG